MRKLGIDFGDARIGLAISDPLGMIASGLDTLKSAGMEKDSNTIASLCKKHEVDTIVLGLPLNMDGSSGARVEKTKIFADILKEKTGLKIEFVDERLTTVESEKILIELGRKRDQRKEVIDKISAIIILQNYLNRKF